MAFKRAADTPPINTGYEAFKALQLMPQAPHFRTHGGGRTGRALFAESLIVIGLWAVSVPDDHRPAIANNDIYGAIAPALALVV
nr:hypothetical protein [Alcaligenes faecalis]